MVSILYPSECCGGALPRDGRGLRLLGSGGDRDTSLTAVLGIELGQARAASELLLELLSTLGTGKEAVIATCSATVLADSLGVLSVLVRVGLERRDGGSPGGEQDVHRGILLWLVPMQPQAE